MKRLSIFLAYLMSTPVLAWDPVSVFESTMQGQVNQQIYRGVSGMFRSIETPSAGTRPANAEIRDARPGEIVLYGTPNCGYCKQARVHLQSRGIPFLEKDVSSNAQAESEWRALGGRGVPLTIMGSHKLTGFSAASFDKTYAQFQTEQASGASTASGRVQSVAKPGNQVASASNVAYSAGDLLSVRIARVKLLAEPRLESNVLGQLEKKEEVIYLGEAQGRYLKVKSAAAEGWVDQALIVKP
ncbi:MAG: glutaredoxin domain-containing protein [Thiobacillus sp.]|nr:glutaredoxin domain-containing protein [Thiobacillus sp.]